MSEYITRRRHRKTRVLLHSCTAMLIGAMLFCTAITVCLAHSLHAELAEVGKAQEDVLSTLMWHRVSTESELIPPVEAKPPPEHITIILNDSDRALVTRTVMSESNSLEGMMAVAQVIHNRAVLWNMSVHEVVIQKSQFAKPYSGELTEEAVSAVSAVFDEGHRVFDSNVTHFHSMDVAEPYWTKKKRCVGEAGGNRFWI